MRFLLDMGASPRTAGFLREQGHEAVHLWEHGLQALSDAEITAKAASEQRILITFDLHFSRLLALGRRDKPSVILFRLDKFTTDLVNHLLMRILETHGQDLTEGAIIVAESHRVRCRRLPLW